jgi:serine/threonine-protein kinase HipA
MDDLDVWINDAHVGVLHRRTKTDLELVYTEEWTQQAGATPLSVSLPLVARTHRGPTLSAYLWGLLPDNDRVVTRWASAAQCSPSDVFGLLRSVGADVAGAARFLPTGSSAKVRAGFARLTNEEVGAHITDLRRDSATWHRANSGRWSLAGAQPKLALAYDDALQTWGIPTGSRPTTHILKPGIVGLTDHHVNEHLCLAAASRVGLRAAASSIEQFGDERVLVVARYDRLCRGKVTTRVHQEDCCQALGVHPGLKYQIDGGPGVEEIVSLIRNVAITDASEDVNRLLLGVGFNWLILGTDAHAKNWSLLLSGAQVRLAPLYDVASAVLGDEHPKKLRLAQKIGGEYRPASIAARHWERLASSAHVDAERLVDGLVVMADRLGDAFADARSATPLTPSEAGLARRLVDEVAGWSGACRRRLTHVR